jgi:hypothetical protein
MNVPLIQRRLYGLPSQRRLTVGALLIQIQSHTHKVTEHGACPSRKIVPSRCQQDIPIPAGAAGVPVSLYAGFFWFRFEYE